MFNRKEQIDFLLRRRFGSLAPPPPTTLDRVRTRLDASMDEARYRQTLAVAGLSDPRPTIESARAEYEALSISALQDLVNAAQEEDARKAQKWADDVKAKRERCWPRWARKDLWSEAEFAALCCGFVPDERGMPGDPGKIAGSDIQAVAINRASDDIRRGTLSKLLAFVPRDDADTASTMYGTARHYVPAIAVEWAAPRFDTFPESLLIAVREAARSADPAATAPSAPIQEGGLKARERNNLLRVIRALDAMNPKPLPQVGYAESIRTKLDQLGLIAVSDDTIRKAIEDARKLDS